MSAASIPRYWRETKYRYRLVGTRCPRCGKIYFPHRLVCGECGERKLANYKLNEKGKVITFTVIRREAPADYEKTVPYIVAIIELEDGMRILSQLVDCNPDEVKIGMPAELTFRKVREDGKEGIIEYGYKFRPTLNWQ